MSAFHPLRTLAEWQLSPFRTATGSKEVFSYWGPMTAFSPIRKTFADAAWDDAILAVNAWRGSVLHSFAEAEMAVGLTLLALSKVPKRGASIQLRRLVGQRFEDLRSAVAAQGPFEKEGLKARTALEAFQVYDALTSDALSWESQDRLGSKWVTGWSLSTS